MAYAHVAHDCHVGSRVIMANCASLAGHVTVEDGAILGGLVAVALLLSRRATRKTKIAYAPYLAAGAVIALWGILG